MDFRHGLIAVALVAGLGAPGWGQDGSATPAESPTPTSTASASATPVSGAELAARLEQGQSRAAALEGSAAVQGSLGGVDKQVATLEASVTQATEALKIEAPVGGQLELWRNRETLWAELESQSSTLKSSLEAQSAEIDAQLKEVSDLQSFWTAEKSTLGSDVELSKEVDALTTRLTSLSEALGRSRARVLLALTRATSLDSRIALTQAQVAETRRQVARQALTERGTPLWQADLRSLSPGGLLSTLQTQLQALGTYAGRHFDRFLTHFLVFVALAAFFRWARPRVLAWVEKEPALARRSEAFRSPALTGWLLSLVLSRWLYADAPPLLLAGLGLTAMLPALLLLRRLLPKGLQPYLYALSLLFLGDQLRALASGQPALQRLIFVGEMVLALLLLGWELVSAAGSSVWGRRLTAGAFVALAVALGCSCVGYVALGYFLGDAVLQAAYMAGFLYAIQQLLEGLLMFSLRAEPLNYLASIREHRTEWRVALRSITRALAVLLWVIAVLDSLALRQRTNDLLYSGLHASVKLGSFQPSVGGVLGMMLAIWIATRLSRLGKLVLSADVFPRTKLGAGTTYTLQTLLHYTILTIGVLFGLGALGIDTAKLALVDGALSVGIGFGLQNIVNNFVSGLILLFERPIEVGDQVEISGQSGTLKTIGLRASVVTTGDGADVIVPNGSILSNQVVNWTLTNNRRRVNVLFGVAVDSDLGQVRRILLETVNGHAEVMSTPAPDVLLTNLGETTLDVSLRFWVEQAPRWKIMECEIRELAYTKLVEAGVDLPFSRRDIEVLNWPAARAEGTDPQVPS